MMIGGWTNSESFIPFFQTLFTTRDEKLMVGLDRRTIRGRHRAAEKEKGTGTVCRMVREAKKAGIPFDFVLFDTWFSNPARLIELKGMETDTIAQHKIHIDGFFKLTQSCLKLRTECHSTSHDALTSHMVVVAIRYMILSVERFRNSDNRRLEDLSMASSAK